MPQELAQPQLKTQTTRIPTTMTERPQVINNFDLTQPLLNNANWEHDEDY